MKGVKGEERSMLNSLVVDVDVCVYVCVAFGYTPARSRKEERRKEQQAIRTRGAGEVPRQ